MRKIIAYLDGNDPVERENLMTEKLERTIIEGMSLSKYEGMGSNLFTCRQDLDGRPRKREGRYIDTEADGFLHVVKKKKKKQEEVLFVASILSVK